MNESPIQDCYPDEIAICYGCGRNNPDGLHIQTVIEAAVRSSSEGRWVTLAELD